MSEIQRYDILTQANGTEYMQAWPAGEYVKHTDLLWYKRHWLMQTILTGVLTVLIFFAWMIHEKSPNIPVTVQIEAGEKFDLQKEMALKEKVIKDLKTANMFHKEQIRHLNSAIANTQAQIDIAVPKIDSALVLGEHVSRLNKEQAQRMNTHQGVVMEAKRVLGVNVVIK